MLPADLDLSNSEKNGILYLEDKLDGEWIPHFFVLNGSKMFYTEVHQEENEPEEADEEDRESAQKKPQEVSGNILETYYQYEQMILGSS